jgi:hypothetical protein
LDGFILGRFSHSCNTCDRFNSLIVSSPVEEPSNAEAMSGAGIVTGQATSLIGPENISFSYTGFQTGFYGGYWISLFLIWKWTYTTAFFRI